MVHEAVTCYMSQCRVPTTLAPSTEHWVLLGGLPWICLSTICVQRYRTNGKHGLFSPIFGIVSWYVASIFFLGWFNIWLLVLAKQTAHCTPMLLGWLNQIDKIPGTDENKARFTTNQFNLFLATPIKQLRLGSWLDTFPNFPKWLEGKDHATAYFAHRWAEFDADLVIQVVPAIPIIILLINITRRLNANIYHQCANHC